MAARRLVQGIILSVIIATTAGCSRDDYPDDIRVDPAFEVPDAKIYVPPLGAELQEVATAVTELLVENAIDESDFLGRPGRSVAIYVALRAKGEMLGSAWASERTLSESLDKAVTRAKSQTTESLSVDTVELVLAHDFRPFNPRTNDSPISNVARGHSGLELRYGDSLFMLSPTRMLADNKSFLNYIDALNKRWRLTDAEISEQVQFRNFRAHQYLIRLDPTVVVEKIFRGNQLIRPHDVNRAGVTAMAERLGNWVLQNIHADGRMTYLYQPGQGEDKKRNNMVRQWMATVSLMQIARDREDGSVNELAGENLRYNLRNFYRQEGNLGLIEYGKKAKLGAIAIAAQSIMRSPDREALSDKETALTRTIDHLWNEDGSFRTFYKPAERNDVQNFYPGEALLTWAMMYQESNDPALLQRIMKSFEYYRRWHLNNRNPAFIPWHTQAYYRVWQETRDEKLAEWIFEMNDWLLGVQQRSERSYPDTDGRFYDPYRPFGPPHASSTAVYLEGLIDAFAMARALQDDEHAKRYRVAIVRGLRSLMQLEFADDIDMFYVTEPERVQGGMRTTVYDSQIRVDNVQHTLMALRKVLSIFADSDFSP